MEGTTEHELPSALELIQRNLDALKLKRRAQGLRSVEEMRYSNLRELQDALLGREAS